jgi:hypothetical protein
MGYDLGGLGSDGEKKAPENATAVAFYINGPMLLLKSVLRTVRQGASPLERQRARPLKRLM